MNRLSDKRALPGKLSAPQIAILIFLPIAAAAVALCAGRMTISVSDVIKVFGNHLGFEFEVSKFTDSAVWNNRLPRIILSILVGGGLSVAGCAFQGVFANPLATPDTLGAASGSSFGAALAILFGFGLPGIQSLALFFGISAVAVTHLCSKGKGLSGTVLAGIMIGSLFSSLISLVKFVADTDSQLPAITYWLMGSLSSASYRSLIIGAPIIIISVLLLFLLRWRMNLLPLSDDEAKSSGTNIRALRAVTVICASAITASCVSMCGQVGWVGLLVPHMCRMRFGNNYLSLIPSSICVGSTFMILVDTLARSATAAEIPVSIITAIIGAPFFIYLLKRSDFSA